MQVARETDKQENIVETWLSLPRSEKNLILYYVQRFMLVQECIREG